MGLDVFNNKIAIVTGAASGLGRGMATKMAEHGATIIASDIDWDGVNQTVAEIEAKGGRAEAHRLDVTDSDAVTAHVDSAVAQHGRLDYIFNNAGLAVNGPADEIPIKDWDMIIDVNLKGVVYGTSAAYKHMAKQRHGHIVNTASLAGLVPSPLLSPYSTTKFGVVGLCESLRLEAKPRGVNVTALCPGFIDSKIYENARYSGGMDAEMGRGQIPMIVSTEKGVDILLKGVAAKKRIVTLPAYGHIFWWTYRLVPSLVAKTSSLLAMRMRKAMKTNK